MSGAPNDGSSPIPNNAAPTPQRMPSNMMMPPGPHPPPYGNPYGFFPPQIPPMIPPYPGFTSPVEASRNSSSREDKETPEVHVITLHPRGMPRPFDVPFPERRLPVCDRCKKNYKSRDLCRTRDGHKTLPWTATYVAVTIDASLIVQEDDGRESYADVPAIGLLMDTPLMCLGPADGSMKSEPICKVCREKNYTRDYCRNTCKHTTPPWSTTYVKIVADTRGEGERLLGYGCGKGRGVKRRKKSVPGEDEEDGKVKSEGSGGEVENLSAFDASYEGEEEDRLKSDDLMDIHSSRTFLAAVSSKSVIVRWCERIQYPESAENTTLETAFKKFKEEDETQDPPAASTGTALQPPPTLPNTTGMSTATQQQLWDAFRAGAMWAQTQHGPPGAMPPGYGYGMPMPGFFGQPGPGGGDMHPGGPWGGGPFGGYGGPMNGGGQGGTPQGGGVPQDWNKNSGGDEDHGE